MTDVGGACPFIPEPLEKFDVCIWSGSVELNSIKKKTFKIQNPIYFMFTIQCKLCSQIQFYVPTTHFGV